MLHTHAVFANGGYFVPVVNKGGFSDAPSSNYRSMLSSCSYYMEDFDYRSILFDNGDIVQCIDRNRTALSNPILPKIFLFGLTADYFSIKCYLIVQYSIVY